MRTNCFVDKEYMDIAGNGTEVMEWNKYDNYVKVKITDIFNAKEDFGVADFG